MRRRLLTFVCAVSLMLCVFTSLLWAATQRRDWTLERVARGRTYLVLSGNGKLMFSVSPLGPVSLGVQIRQRTFAGCTLLTDRDRRGLGVTVVVPHVYVVAAFAVLPFIWIVRIWRRERRRVRARSGFCDRCGYDLRTSSSRCPRVRVGNSAKLIPSPKHSRLYCRRIIVGSGSCQPSPRRNQSHFRRSESTRVRYGPT